jgi:hypothetical protein
MTLGQPLLILCSTHDQVVTPGATQEARDWLDAPLIEIFGMGKNGDPMSHRRAGDILAQRSTDIVASHISEPASQSGNGKNKTNWE